MGSRVLMGARAGTRVGARVGAGVGESVSTKSGATAAVRA
jgi:hypothetical protein